MGMQKLQGKSSEKKLASKKAERKIAQILRGYAKFARTEE
jgi:hypothetical protein